MPPDLAASARVRSGSAPRTERGAGVAEVAACGVAVAWARVGGETWTRAATHRTAATAKRTDRPNVRIWGPTRTASTIAGPTPAMTLARDPRWRSGLPPEHCRRSGLPPEHRQRSGLPPEHRQRSGLPPGGPGSSTARTAPRCDAGAPSGDAPLDEGFPHPNLLALGRLHAIRPWRWGALTRSVLPASHTTQTAADRIGVTTEGNGCDEGRSCLQATHGGDLGAPH
jgi:hypothetical protein